MNSKLIKDIFKGTTSELLNNIPNEYKEELAKEYYAYLNNFYKDKSIPTDGYEKVLANEMKFQKDIALSKPPIMKLCYFLKDKGNDELRRLSALGLEKARDRLKDNKSISEEEKDEKIESLKKAFDEVRPFNIISAQRELSEGILDYEYAASGREMYSLRLGHEVRFYKEVNKNNKIN